MNKKNIIEIIGNGNIVIQDVVGSKIEINPNIKSDLQDLKIFFNNKMNELPSKIIELLETKLDIDINKITKIEKQDLIISIDRLVIPKNKSDMTAFDYDKENKSKLLVEQLYKIFIKENYPVNKFMHFDNSATEIRYKSIPLEIFTDIKMIEQ